MSTLRLNLGVINASAEQLAVAVLERLYVWCGRPQQAGADKIATLADVVSVREGDGRIAITAAIKFDGIAGTTKESNAVRLWCVPYGPDHSTLEVPPNQHTFAKPACRDVDVMLRERFDGPVLAVARRLRSETFDGQPAGKRAEPKVEIPSRLANVIAWRETWRVIGNKVDRMDASAIGKWLQQNHGKLPYSEKTVRKIIAAGRAGLFNT